LGEVIISQGGFVPHAAWVRQYVPALRPAHAGTLAQQIKRDTEEA